jgi:spore maturation protein CgeB
MKIVMFYHSLLSDWNHGNAHFLRGVVWELLQRGHDVQVYEPLDAWSLKNLRAEYGEVQVRRFFAAYPGLSTNQYELESLKLDDVLKDARLVIVHEWNDHELVRRIGEHRSTCGRYQLLFHDTHHRAVTDEASMAKYDLRHYDGVLAFGNVLRDLYLQRKWTARAWTWHEAADPRVFKPLSDRAAEGDLVWIGNWGDEERTAELHEFLLQPVKRLGLRAQVHGVRYPEHARTALDDAGIEYAGWLPNFDAAKVFARFRLTVHIPRRPYVQALPGIPTIRVFETLACGIPLISSTWVDAENLFTPGEDFLLVANGSEMARQMRRLLNDQKSARQLADHGRQTILSRHTCGHRVDQLLEIAESLRPVLPPRRPLSVPETPFRKPRRAHARTQHRLLRL